MTPEVFIEFVREREAMWRERKTAAVFTDEPDLYDSCARWAEVHFLLSCYDNPEEWGFS